MGRHDGQKPIGAAKRALAAEFTRPLDGLAFHALPDPDTYAPETGFVAGFLAARDAERGRAWATHCYGMVGAGRDTDADSGGGTELYVVSGHAPRQLDRNITLVGRVVRAWSSSLRCRVVPGRWGSMRRRSNARALHIRLAADVPAAERRPLVG